MRRSLGLAAVVAVLAVGRFSSAADDALPDGHLITIPTVDASGAASPKDAERREIENVLLYQRKTGGWPKNYDRKQELTETQRIDVLNDKSKNDSMIDNGATHTEIRLVADAFRKTGDERFKQAALRGIRYLLEGQYDNGGWPQQFPVPSGYARYITFNDNAMVGVLSLLGDVARGNQAFSFLPDDVRQQCRQAVERGIRCILKCQIRVDGKPTVWCAQHDHVTFEPQKARSYELPSLSGSESVGIVRFLMQIEDPSDEVIRAIEGAVAWFERSKLEGIKVVRVEDAAQPNGYDQVVVEDPTAPPMWARFYDVNTNRPIFCSRDGIPRRTLAEISYERRNGYSWLGYYAQGLLERDLPSWKHRLGIPGNSGDMS
ncbi:MAG TPA: pectate lyase [Thermoguttaceae bacterium]|nr:pectate lyase [Thermoguttaceae bacterium]